MAGTAIPNIDPNVRFVGVSKLRDLNASKLREQDEQTLVIQENDTPLSVLLPYKRYLEIKREFEAMLNMIEMLTNENERKGLLAAFEDINAGRFRTLADIDADLEKE
jgi:lipid A disaccharide synthetase